MIETNRLTIIPLNYAQLLKYIQNDGSFEAEFNLISATRVISQELMEALEQMIAPNVKNNPEYYIYYTIWALILKSPKQGVGDFCIYSEPNSNGEIEIGYGTYEEHRNKGYMTEAVAGLINFANSQAGIKSILASTNKDNVASYSVLLKNNFVKIGESGDLFNWKYEIKK